MAISIILWVVMFICIVALVAFTSKEFWRNKNNELKEILKKDSEKNINNLFGITKTTFLTIIVNLIIISIAFLSFFETVKQSKETSLINQQSIELAKDVNRPYLFVDKVDLKPLLNDEYDYKLTLTIKNAGPIPALVTNYAIDFAGEPLNFYDGQQTHLYGPGDEGGLSLFINKDKVLTIKNDTDPRKYLNIKTKYQDSKGNSYCIESRYSSVIVGGTYKINSVSSNECME